jgi:hypothetical protein
MKRLLILTVLGLLLGGVAGCRFMECLWRGPACQQNTAPTVTYANPCSTSPCDPCGGTPAVVMPGPVATQ